MKGRVSPKLIGVLLGSLGLLWAAVVAAAPGDRDATFGQGGGFTYAVPNMVRAWAYRVFEQADQKLVAVGFAQSSSDAGTQDFLIIRFNADGSPDDSFGTQGRVHLDFGGATSDVAWGGVQQAVDGKLVIVGTSTANGSPQMAIARLMSNGQLDTTFGLANSGKFIVPINNGNATDAFIESTGKIVMSGSMNGDAAFVRLMPDGVLDPSFNPGDIVNPAVVRIHYPSGFVQINRTIKQDDGKYLSVGRSLAPGPLGGTVYSLIGTRVNGNGTLDTNLGGTGFLTYPCDGPCNGSGITQQPDGKLILSGYTSGVGEGNPLIQQEESLVARFSLNGTLDATFGTNGTITGLFVRSAPTFISSGDEAVETIVDASSGAITILGSLNSRIYNLVGTTVVTAVVGTAVARVSSTGVLDTSFGYGGVAIVNNGTQTAVIPYNVVIPRTLVRLQSGRMLVLSMPGQYVNGVAQAQAISMARLLNSGSDPGVLAAAYPGPMTESIGNAVVRVFRSGGAAGQVTVDYSTLAGTATAGLDFTMVSGRLTWADGDYSVKLVSVPIVSDAILESSNESFAFVLSSPTGGAGIVGESLGGALGPATTLTIARDDVAPASTVTLSQLPVSVAENAGTVSLTVTRTGTTPLTVNYYTIPASATSGSDFARTSGILVWSTSDTSPKTIVVPINNDSMNEASEAFNVVLVTPVVGTVLGGQSTTVTIVDDEPLQLSISNTTVTASETQPSITLNVVRTGVTVQTVSVNYATANGSATAGADYTSTSATLTWLPTDSDTKTITIPLTNDTTYEGSETFTVTLSSPTSGATLGIATATVTIADDEVAQAPSFGNDVLSDDKKSGGGAVDASSMAFLAGLLFLQWGLRRRSSRR